MEDVRAQAIGRRILTLRQDQGLVEEDYRLADARLRVADDADLEDDLGTIDVGEARGHGQRSRVLEERHRAFEISGAYPRPRLAAEKAQRKRRRCDGAGQVAHASKRLERLVVSRRLDEQLGLAQGRLEPLGVRVADAVLEERTVGGQTVGEPVQRVTRRPRLPALDLADVLLREAAAGEVGLTQPGRAPKRTKSFADSRHAAFLRLLPVSIRHTGMVARSGDRRHVAARRASS